MSTMTPIPIYPAPASPPDASDLDKLWISTHGPMILHWLPHAATIGVLLYGEHRYDPFSQEIAATLLSEPQEPRLAAICELVRSSGPSLPRVEIPAKTMRLIERSGTLGPHKRCFHADGYTFWLPLSDRDRPQLAGDHRLADTNG